MEQEINGKVQKINDEDYEIIRIIETETYPGAIRWYKNTYDCDLLEAVNSIENFKKKYGVDHIGLYSNLDIEDVVFMYDMYKLRDQIDRSKVTSDFFKMEPWEWIMSKTGWSEDEAMKADGEGMNEWVRRNSDKIDKKGCAITLLIAITSTLSIGSLIVFYL